MDKGNVAGGGGEGLKYVGRIVKERSGRGETGEMETGKGR